MHKFIAGTPARSIGYGVKVLDHVVNGSVRVSMDHASSSEGGTPSPQKIVCVAIWWRTHVHKCGGMLLDPILNPRL